MFLRNRLDMSHILKAGHGHLLVNARGAPHRYYYARSEHKSSPGCHPPYPHRCIYALASYTRTWDKANANPLHQNRLLSSLFSAFNDPQADGAIGAHQGSMPLIGGAIRSLSSITLTQRPQTIEKTRSNFPVLSRVAAQRWAPVRTVFLARQLADRRHT